MDPEFMKFKKEANFKRKLLNILSEKVENKGFLIGKFNLKKKHQSTFN